MIIGSQVAAPRPLSHSRVLSCFCAVLQRVTQVLDSKGVLTRLKVSKEAVQLAAQAANQQAVLR